MECKILFTRCKILFTELRNIHIFTYSELFTLIRTCFVLHDHNDSVLRDGTKGKIEGCIFKGWG